MNTLNNSKTHLRKILGLGLVWITFGPQKAFSQPHSFTPECRPRIEVRQAPDAAQRLRIYNGQLGDYVYEFRVTGVGSQTDYQQLGSNARPKTSRIRLTYHHITSPRELALLANNRFTSCPSPGHDTNYGVHLSATCIGAQCALQGITRCEKPKRISISGNMSHGREVVELQTAACAFAPVILQTSPSTGSFQTRARRGRSNSPEPRCA